MRCNRNTDELTSLTHSIPDLNIAVIALTNFNNDASSIVAPALSVLIPPVLAYVQTNQPSVLPPQCCAQFEGVYAYSLDVVMSVVYRPINGTS